MHQWQGHWIWASEHREVNGHVLFRNDFSLAKAGGEATLYIAAESFARVWVNDVEIGRTTSISYPTQHYYETFDVAAALQTGENRIAVLAWYIGVPSGASCPKDPGLLCEIVDQNGTAIAATSEAWLCRPLDAWRGKQRRSHWLNLDLIEILDLRRLPVGFPMVSDLCEFAAAEDTGFPGVRFAGLQPRPFAKPTGQALEGISIHQQGTVTDISSDFPHPHGAMVRETITPADLGISDLTDFTLPPLTDGLAATIILDLGAYEKGYPELVATGCEAAEIDIAWFEKLEPQDPNTTAAKVYTADRFILAAGPNAISPEEWKTGRYLQLTFRHITQPLRIQGLRWIRSHYPLEEKVRFESSDDTLNRIWQISLSAAAACMHDNIMDCPWRERRQWIGDAQRIGLISHYAFTGGADLIRGVLRQHAHLQDPSGRMWVCLPVFEEYPTQSMEWLRAVMEYQHYTGDETLLPELAGVIERLFAWFDSCRDPAGLLHVTTPPVMNWMDNPYGSVVTPSGTIRDNQLRTAFCAMNLRYLLFLDDVAAAMDQLSRADIAVSARAQRSRIEQLIVPQFYDDDTGLLRDCAKTDIAPSYSELAHALAVLADIPSLDGEALWDRFCKYRSGGGEVIEASPFGAYQTHEALGKLGRPDAILQDILTRWGPMVDAGADTTWERFDGAGSQCHGWAGVPVVAIMKHILKLDPTAKIPATAHAKNIAGVDSIQATVLD